MTRYYKQRLKSLDTQKHQIADLHDLSSWRQKEKEQLSVLYANIRGLRGSKAQLKFTIFPTVIDIACFTETLIISADGVTNGELLLDRYELFCRDDKLYKLQPGRILPVWTFCHSLDGYGGHLYLTKHVVLSADRV